MNPLYPLKFHPIFKEKIWGGSKIRDILKKDYGSLPNCGESWEISAVPGNVSIVSNGPLEGESLQKIIQEYKDQLTGKDVFDKFGSEFPLLIKFIDANEDLSIQVHPNDLLAKKRHNSLGKTEMWYILQADPQATLISGFNRSITKNEYLDNFEKGKLMGLLNKEEVSPGDVFYLPAGRVHTIGKGLLLAEIQQTSDVTYRIYDFDRTDSEGNKRELHTEYALDALDFSLHEEYKTSYKTPVNSEEIVIQSQYFQTTIQQVTGTSPLLLVEHSFTILLAVDGKGQIEYDGIHTSLNMGESVLIPASNKNIRVSSLSGITFLKTFIPK